MRLTSEHINRINHEVDLLLGNDCKTLLFGSRLDDQARGGDIDLLVEAPETVSKLTQARLKATLEKHLGLPVDLLITAPDIAPSAFTKIALAQAVPLKESKVA